MTSNFLVLSNTPLGPLKYPLDPFQCPSWPSQVYLSIRPVSTSTPWATCTHSNYSTSTTDTRDTCCSWKQPLCHSECYCRGPSGHRLSVTHHTVAKATGSSCWAFRLLTKLLRICARCPKLEHSLVTMAMNWKHDKRHKCKHIHEIFLILVPCPAATTQF